MRSRALFSVLVIAAALALVGGATFAVFTDTQTAEGTVNAGTIDLYLLESDDDDNGANEFVFEVTENLLPGETATGTVRLRNDGNRAFDLVLPVGIAVLETNDPGGDCNSEPTPHVHLAFVVPDDHGGTYHLEPGAQQDLTVDAHLSSGVTNECQANAWLITYTFEVTQHGP
ncbi:MAG TPA: TasA family protein [Anaerolineales bacterium]|nr:TasA family protein [Anaerolineales bacterium]